jgi:hypothetical protein
VDPGEGRPGRPEPPGSAEGAGPATAPDADPDLHPDADPEIEPELDTTPSARLERSWIGQLAIGALVAVLLASQVATHLPSSALARATSPSADRALRTLGSEQAWGVFSPDPRRTSLDLEARITFADGTSTTWEVPSGPRVGANLRFYRWRKWLERIRSDQARGFWEPTARWLAEEHAGGPSPVVRVELIRYFRDNAVVGPQPEWQQAVFHTLDVTPDDGEGTS